jgi:hypothetical protein
MRKLIDIVRMKHMKKTFQLLVGGMILAGFLTGCGSQSTSDNTQTAGGSGNQQRSGNHQFRGGGQGQQLNEVSKILGIDTQTITNDLKAGQSIVDIAKTKNITEQQLITQLKAQRQTQLDKMVKNGTITQEQEQNLLSNADNQIKTMIEHKGPFVQNRGGHNWNGNNSGSNSNNGNTNNNNSSSDNSNVSQNNSSSGA